MPPIKSLVEKAGEGDRTEREQDTEVGWYSPVCLFQLSLLHYLRRSLL